MGTWEELLLVCTVHHCGTESWDSISAELWKQSTTTSSHLTVVNKSTLTSNAVSTKTPANITSFAGYEADNLPLVNSDSIPVLGSNRSVPVSKFLIPSLSLSLTKNKQQRENREKESVLLLCCVVFVSNEEAGRLSCFFFFFFFFLEVVVS